MQLNTSIEVLLEDFGFRFLIKVGLLVAFFLIVNIFGYLLINKKRQQRVAALLIQYGMTAKRVRRINLILSFLLSAPVLVLGMLAAKPLADDFVADFPLSYSYTLLLFLFLVYALFLIIANLVIARQQRGVSIYTLYREA